MATLNFNADQVEPQTPMDVLPPGKYLCMAIASELKPTKNNSGEYLQITFEVIDGAGKGRKIWDRLNIRNQNKQAEEIAQRQLSALCHAVGVIQLNDSEQLHNLPVVLDLGVEDGRDGYSPQNRVKGYSAAGGAPARPAAARPAAAAPAAGGAKPVWRRTAAA